MNRPTEKLGDWTIRRRRNGEVELLTGLHSGICIAIRKGSRSLVVWGWYDGSVGIKGAELRLDELLTLFGNQVKL